MSIDIDMINEMAQERVMDELIDEVDTLDEKAMAEIEEFAQDSGLHLDDDLDDIIAGVAQNRWENGGWD